MAWSRDNNRGYDHTYRKARAIVMAEEPLCRMCGVRLATECDHITPKHKGGTDARSNLQALCKPCHTDKTARESVEARGGTYRAKPTFGVDGWPVRGS